jgi:hydrogenase nickel incorporation protein HypB
MEIKLYRNILEANDVLAERNRQMLREKKILCLNLIGSPGSGKTTVLERTIEHLLAEGKFTPAVIEGDIATSRDAERIARKGARAVQINTEGGCHLDASMVRAALDDMLKERMDILFIENVGNLVCPSEFDLGEDAKVVIYSVAEGDDKPLKYPVIFEKAKICVINKIDLLPYVDFDLEKVKAEIQGINPKITIIALSSKTGKGLEEWLTLLRHLAQGEPIA